ncbi:MAG: hypothetical protein WB622_06030, partial [Acidobacteriaceae bacterium]
MPAPTAPASPPQVPANLIPNVAANSQPAKITAPGPFSGVPKLPPLPSPSESPVMPDTLGMAASQPATPPPLPPLPRALIQNGSPEALQMAALDSDIARRQARTMPHPSDPGFWHKVEHVVAQAGNIAGDIFAPSTMALIPQTDLGNRVALNRDLAERAGLQAQQREDQNAESQRTLEGAQAAEAAGTGDRQRQELNAQLAEHGLQIGDDGKIAPVSPENLSPALRAQLIPKSEFELFQREHPGATAEDFQKFQSKPLSAEQANALNATWNAIAQQYHLPANQFREGMATADATALASSLNNAIGKGQGAQKITVNAGNTGSARADKSFQYNNGELDKLSTPITGLVQRMSTLQSNLAQESPQADALVAPELLSVMAGGQGSG